MDNIRISNICPIDRYYKVSNKVLDTFEEKFDEIAQSNTNTHEHADPRLLDDAYIYGRRYAVFVSQVLPKHDYFESTVPKYVNLRNMSIIQCKKVIEKMEIIADWMDMQELEAARLRKVEEQKRQDEDLQRKLEKLMPKAPVGQVREKEKSNSSSSAVSVVPEVAPPPTFEEFLENEGTSGESPVVTIQPDDDTISAITEMPHIPLPPPPTVPPASIIKPPSLDWGSVDPSASSLKPPEDAMPMIEVIAMYTRKFESLKQNRMISIHNLGTHQGRLKEPGKDSTNGCTVISALVAQNHLKPGPAIPNSQIESVIDIDAPPILRKVRVKLGLTGDALIIPSDVNDYFVDNNMLRQDQFVGVCGGNIMDEEHMGELLKLMQCGLEQKGVSDKKVAATFFFHEHVICILKTFTLKGELRYELVDSMPRNMKPGPGPASAVRVRCLDIEGLQVLLSWYACSRFSDSNCDFIDQHGWDENNCDFDPRVFQAFVWSEL